MSGLVSIVARANPCLPRDGQLLCAIGLSLAVRVKKSKTTRRQNNEAAP
jgi:hypothetical protein